MRNLKHCFTFLLFAMTEEVTSCDLDVLRCTELYCNEQYDVYLKYKNPRFTRNDRESSTCKKQSNELI